MLFIPKGWSKAALGGSDEITAWSLFSTRYPAVASRLNSFAAKARARSDQGDFWWELRPCDYYDLFDQDVIIFPEMSQGSKFALKRAGSVSNNKTFLLPCAGLELLGFLNSRLAWFLLNGICTALRGGIWRLELRSDFVKDLPVPAFVPEVGRALANLASICVDSKVEFEERRTQVQRRLNDLVPLGRQLPRKLERWWELDFAAFRAAFEGAYRMNIPVKERDEWEAYLMENAAHVRALLMKIADAEREIDAIVYRQFELTHDEIGVLEESIEAAR